MSKLIVCAGRTKRAGWVTLDCNARTAPDIVATIPPLPDSVLAERWEAIELIHGIEHFYRWQAIDLLRSFYGILQPGGQLILEQPNIAYAARVLLGLVDPPRDHPEQFSMWPLYGDPGHRSEWFCHRWGYTPESLRESLLLSGFKPKQIEEKPARHHFPIRDFRMIATK